jgi:hypothetical protein
VIRPGDHVDRTRSNPRSEDQGEASHLERRLSAAWTTPAHLIARRGCALNPIA